MIVYRKQGRRGQRTQETPTDQEKQEIQSEYRTYRSVGRRRPRTPLGRRVTPDSKAAVSGVRSHVAQHLGGVGAFGVQGGVKVARGGRPCPPGIPPIGLSAPETARIDRLARGWKAGLLSLARLAVHLRWSAWRRRHQARARWHRYSTRLAALAT
jgi:hypothetical protein